LRLWHIARSVLSNWFATGAMLAVGFFLQPFIVHQLGNVAYGVWVLAVSCINYLAMLDLGMGSSVVRFISKGHASKNHQESSDALSAVLWVRLQISALTLLLSAGLAAMFARLFAVPSALAVDARMAILIIGVTTAISMTFGVFGSALSALNRYDLKSYATLVQLTIRVVGVVAILRSGRGIVAIACCEFVAAVVGNILLACFSHRSYPEMRIHLGKPTPQVLRKIWSYSAYAFLITVAIQLVYQSDNMVVGVFVSTSAVTFYAIGNTLCRYTQQVVGAMTATFTPAASAYEATGDLVGLKHLYSNGTRVTLAISLPIVTTLIIRGSTFVGVWMGPQYSRSSGTVLAILATTLMFSVANHTAGSIAFGVGKHKTVAWWSIGEGIANVILSIILARKFGIYGVAIGTLIPSLAIQLIMWPIYISRLVPVTWLQVFLHVWGPVFLCVAPFAAASYVVDLLVPTHNMLTFMLQTVGLLPLFVVTVGVTFRRSIKRLIVPRVKSFFYAHAN
jgi:O-antigen/teichoic acid export membrane protein